MYLGKRWGMTLWEESASQGILALLPTCPTEASTHTDWSGLPSRSWASCLRSVLLGASSKVCFSLVYSTLPPLARSLGSRQY